MEKAGLSYLFSTAMAVWTGLVILTSPYVGPFTVVLLFMAVFSAAVSFLITALMLGVGDIELDMFKNSVKRPFLYILGGVLLGVLGWYVAYAVCSPMWQNSLK